MKPLKDDPTFLISKLLDEGISDDELRELESALAADDRLRRTYLEYVDQQIEFSCLINAHGISKTSTGVIPFPGSRRKKLATLAAAAMLVLTGIAVFLVWKAGGLNQDENVPEIVVPGSDGKSGSKDGKENSPDGMASVADPPDSPAASGLLWEEDFEEGEFALSGWEGEFVSTGLPQDSKGGLKTIRKELGDSRTQRLISLPRGFAGRLELLPGTKLHLNAKIEDGSWFNLFMLGQTQTGDFNLFKLSNEDLNLRHGEWITITIPFDQFQRKNADLDQFVTNLPAGEGEFAFHLFFSSFDPDFTMTIDRIWVSRDSLPN
ncbi:MAG: hypothetical protein HKN23_01915 [Verrucomicrobiales bacterium]|nr:hypothetical protein [Verrucomicrobiales bacterium]